MRITLLAIGQQGHLVPVSVVGKNIGTLDALRYHAKTMLQAPQGVQSSGIRLWRIDRRHEIVSVEEIKDGDTIGVTFNGAEWRPHSDQMAFLESVLTRKPNEDRLDNRFGRGAFNIESGSSASSSANAATSNAQSTSVLNSASSSINDESSIAYVTASNAAAVAAASNAAPTPALTREAAAAAGIDVTNAFMEPWLNATDKI